MGLVDDVQEFVRQANRITEVKELQDLLSGTVQKLGFDYFALVHHVNVFKTKANVVHLFDFPKSWTDLVDKNEYFSDDPVLVACQKSGTPFTWSEVPKLISLTERQQEILRGAQQAGLGDGFTVPIHIPGEITGACSFGTRSGREFPHAALPAANYVGCFAFEAARRLAQRGTNTKFPVRPAAPRPKLTRRQLECVVLAGRGKSDQDVAEILGISGQTVHQHIEDAKRKYEVGTRMQLVVRALFDNQLAFFDLVN